MDWTRILKKDYLPVDLKPKSKEQVCFLLTNKLFNKNGLLG
jgi:hypothetical protein